jgi:hypothetical protein
MESLVGFPKELCARVVPQNGARWRVYTEEGRTDGSPDRVL